MPAQRNWKAAEQTLTASKRAYPDDARVYQRLGSLYFAQKRPDQAITAYEAALTRVPGAIEPLTGLSNVYLAQQKPQLAVDRVEKALKASPDNFLAYALLGRLEAAARRFRAVLPVSRDLSHFRPGRQGDCSLLRSGQARRVQ